jgi:solute carrier family 34 (sodium-dependent phosphate cotransporter)
MPDSDATTRPQEEIGPPGAGHTERRQRRSISILRKAAFGVSAIFLFILAIQLMKSGAKALAPDLKGTFPVDNPVSTLGLGWIGAYLVLSGSPVAAVALSLFAASALTELQAFTMLSGSRLGASFIVLLVGFLYSMRNKNRAESTGMGVLALSLTAVVYLPGMLLGYSILRSGLISGVHWTASSEVEGLIERIWGPLLDLAKSNLSGWMLFPIGLAVILISFKLLDQVLPQIDSDRAGSRRAAWLKRPWPMFALGCIAALLTLSVSVALTLLVPLAAKGYVDRREAMPYIMGANITTLADTLVAAMILGRPEGVQVVLAEAMAVAFITIVYLLFFYRHLQRMVMALDEWVVASSRRLIGFVGVMFVFPSILLVSGRLIGLGDHLATGGAGGLWLGLLVAMLLALPIWAVLDAASRPAWHWETIGESKRGWVTALALTLPLGIGFIVALKYFVEIRRRLSVVELLVHVSVWGDERPL